MDSLNQWLPPPLLPQVPRQSQNSSTTTFACAEGTTIGLGQFRSQFLKAIVQYLPFPILLLAIASNTLAPGESTPHHKNQLTVTIDGFRTQEGQVCLSLFDSEAGFPAGGERALATQCIGLEEATPAITFDIPFPGDYAVAVFHDANGDGTLNVNFFGIPREGFGFSRNPRISMRPPKFEDAAVAVNGASDIEIQLKYMFGS